MWDLWNPINRWIGNLPICCRRGEEADPAGRVKMMYTVPGVHPGVHIKNRLYILKPSNCGVFLLRSSFLPEKTEDTGSFYFLEKIIHLNLASQTHRHKVDFLRRPGRLDLRFDWAWCVMCLVQFQWLCFTINQHSFDSWQLTLHQLCFNQQIGLQHSFDRWQLTPFLPKVFATRPVFAALSGVWSLWDSVDHWLSDRFS